MIKPNTCYIGPILLNIIAADEIARDQCQDIRIRHTDLSESGGYYKKGAPETHLKLKSRAIPLAHNTHFSCQAPLNLYAEHDIITALTVRSKRDLRLEFKMHFGGIAYIVTAPVFMPFITNSICYFNFALTGLVLRIMLTIHVLLCLFSDILSSVPYCHGDNCVLLQC